MARAKRHPKPSDDILNPAQLQQCVQFLIDSLNTIEDDGQSEHNAFAFEYLKKVFLSKYADDLSVYGGVAGLTAEERSRAAIKKWLSVDDLNGLTNHQLLLLEISEGVDEDHEWYSYEDKRINRILRRAAEVVVSVIGSEPPEGVTYGHFSSGASTSLRRSPTTLAQKFLDQAEVTLPASSTARQLVEGSENWRRLGWNDRFAVNPVKGNYLFTVPKNARIDRVACKEPDLNMFSQKGVGDFIRARLRVRGIDLNDQSKNRELARQASAADNLATIDLSSASDTLSSGLVCRLLPISWYVLLNQLRSERTFVDGDWRDLNMFSSMGNGFTFELESLIFYALARATAWEGRVSGTISVYGDDIIVPVEMAEWFMKVLHRCGFLPNYDKTFTVGPFRESCGGHYWNGREVTPFYVRRACRDISDVILVLNQFRKWICLLDREGEIYKKVVFAYHFLASRLVPRSLRGGRDFASRFQLVTDEAPMRVLVPRMRRRFNHEIGAYLLWLRTAEQRQGPIEEPLVTSTVLCEKGGYVQRRVNLAFDSGLDPAMMLDIIMD